MEKADRPNAAAGENDRHDDAPFAARLLIAEDLGELLEGCRQYLELIAAAEVGGDLRAKLGVSDLVQETFLEAQKDIGRFHGGSRDELLAWLRKILLHRLCHVYAQYRGTGKRDVARECRPRQTSLNILEQLFDPEQTSPSGHAVRAEKIARVRQAVGRLPAASRKVVLLRYRDRLTFSEIAAKVGRSPNAVRMLWHRAIDRLADELEVCHE
ncbi:MAG: sigma-70 family RNA polymerase sigma factor [Pirellulales bacterium]|nr:sigma-70 family RNA polymerase sigma factor [Pirellulales bacterium]